MTKNPAHSGPKGPSSEEVPSRHWADTAAEELIKSHPESKTRFVCASGISPSGVVHIGNFREVITVDFVVRALRDRGKEVRFIYSWDDYDALRKVPANLPNPELIEKNLRKPLAKVPDPYGELPSYSARFEKMFEDEIQQLGISPEYIRQNERYRKCDYAEGIRHALLHQKEIAAILNRSRTEPLPSDWTCVSLFCKECDRDTTVLKAFHEPSTLEYRCKACKKDFSMDFSREEGAKLLWRVDWPMRWAKEGVDFEPGGKDHSSTGGSYDTGKQIIKEVWKKEAPYYVQYDFVLAKGAGSKLSSSSGNLITLGEALAVYEPAVVRWLFASRKPNLDFSIAFDLDVMKAYDEFDRCERFAYDLETADEKKVGYEKRIYDLSVVDRANSSAPPPQFPFRHLCNLLQIHEGDLERTRTAYGDSASHGEGRRRFDSRATRAWRWITTFAPVEFRFSLRPAGSEVPKSLMPDAVRALVAILKNPENAALGEEGLAGKVHELLKSHGVEAKPFFQEIYFTLIAKQQGPKLASFLLAIGRERAAELLMRAL